MSLTSALRFDLEAQRTLPLLLPADGPSRCGGGTRLGLGLRGLLGKGVMGQASYEHGSAECETEHRVARGRARARGAVARHCACAARDGDGGGGHRDGGHLGAPYPNFAALSSSAPGPALAWSAWPP